MTTAATTPARQILDRTERLLPGAIAAVTGLQLDEVLIRTSVARGTFLCLGGNRSAVEAAMAVIGTMLDVGALQELVHDDDWCAAYYSFGA